jgi:hypothetical protein
MIQDLWYESHDDRNRNWKENEATHPAEEDEQPEEVGKAKT